MPSVRSFARASMLVSCVIGAMGWTVCSSEAAASEPEQPGPTEQHTGARPGFSLSFAFEPRVGNYNVLDGKLQTYGFSEFGAPLLLTYGLRGRVWLGSGWLLGGSMSYGFAQRRIEANPVPTTLSLIETALSLGHQLGAGFDLTLDLAFAVHNMTIGSPVQGGALTYMGPAVQPRFGYTILRGPSFLRLTLGYSAQFPIGAPHNQPLWGDSYRMPVIHAFLIGVESGFGSGVPRWPPRTTRAGVP